MCPLKLEKKPSSHSQMVFIVLIAAPAIFLEFTRVAGRLYSQLELRSKGIVSAPGYLDSLGRKHGWLNGASNFRPLNLR